MTHCLPVSSLALVDHSGKRDGRRSRKTRATNAEIFTHVGFIRTKQNIRIFIFIPDLYQLNTTHKHYREIV